MTNRTKGFTLAAISAASYGVNPFAVIMYNDGLSVDSVLFYRYAFASVLTAILMLVRHESFKITFKEFFLLLTLGLIFSFSSIALFISYKYIDISIASTLLFCYPAMVTLIMAIFFSEKINKTTIIALILVTIGIFLLNSNNNGTIENIFGVLIVILSSLAYAIYIVSVQKTCLNKMSSIKVGFYSILFGSLIYIVRLNWCTELQIIETRQSAICAIILALFPTLISITALAKAIKYIGSTNAAILGALEPVTAVMLGIVIFDERPTIIETIGMITILSAVTIIIATPQILKKQQKC